MKYARVYPDPTDKGKWYTYRVGRVSVNHTTGQTYIYDGLSEITFDIPSIIIPATAMVVIYEENEP